MLVFALLPAAFFARVVIAAPNGIDHSEETGGAIPLDAIPLLLGAVALVVIVLRRWHRLAHAPARPHSLLPEQGLLLLLGMLVAGWLGASLMQSLTDVDLTEPTEPVLRGPTLLRLGAASLQACLVAGYAWIVLRRHPNPGERRMSPVRAAGIGVCAIALVWPVATLGGWAAGVVHQLLGGAAPDTVAHETLRQLLENPPDIWLTLMTVSVVIIAPIIEEVQYRGLLQESLRRFGLGRWPAVFVTSAAFAAMHLSIAAPHAVAALFILSLGFGWAYERTGRLWAPIVMHVLFNAGNLVLARVLL